MSTLNYKLLKKDNYDNLSKRFGGRLIPKHAKGNLINTNPLPEDPINDSLPKKKRKKLFQVNPNFKNERPVPGFMTLPRIGFGN